MTTPQRSTASTIDGSYSLVTLVGRLGANLEERVLPSGDEITVFTVVVDRQVRRGEPSSSTRVDAIACQASSPGIRRRLTGLGPGDWVRAEGVLRRRFWRSPGGLGSATDVHVVRLARHMRA